MPRNYKKEYKNYHGKPAQRKRRSARTTARYHAEKEGRAKKGDGKDLHHKDGNPLNKKKSNLVLKSKRANRSYARTKSARKKNPRS